MVTRTLTPSLRFGGHFDAKTLPCDCPGRFLDSPFGPMVGFPDEVRNARCDKIKRVYPDKNQACVPPVFADIPFGRTT